MSTGPPAGPLPRGGPYRREPSFVPCQAGTQRGYVASFVRPPSPPDDFWPVVLQAGGAAVGTVFVVAALLGLVVFRFLTRRLGELQRCVAGLADGELSLRVAAPGPDELGDLARSLNRMAERLQHVVGELTANDRRRRDLLADISHELKTPLTVLRGHLEDVLEARPADPGLARSVSVAFEESERLALLIDDLLELARMQSSEFRIARAGVVLQRVVQRAVDRFQLPAANRSIRLETRFEGEPIEIQIDQRRIEQVVANLVQNALKQVETGGTVEVAVAATKEGARITVADDGRGMPPEELETAFDRFKTGAVDAGSTGLGLSIVKRLVEAHGGTVRLERRREGGIRAVIDL
jgi:two-component system sensor histidine kinase BaeS